MLDGSSLSLDGFSHFPSHFTANERTFLAYMRTSLSLLTVGIAVSQLYRLSSGGTGTPTSTSPETQRTLAKTMGCLFVALAGLYIVFGMVRYFFAQSLMVCWLMRVY